MSDAPTKSRKRQSILKQRQIVLEETIEEDPVSTDDKKEKKGRRVTISNLTEVKTFDHQNGNLSEGSPLRQKINETLGSDGIFTPGRSSTHLTVETHSSSSTRITEGSRNFFMETAVDSEMEISIPQSQASELAAKVVHNVIEPVLSENTNNTMLMFANTASVPSVMHDRTVSVPQNMEISMADSTLMEGNDTVAGLFSQTTATAPINWNGIDPLPLSKPAFGINDTMTMFVAPSAKGCQMNVTSLHAMEMDITHCADTSINAATVGNDTMGGLFTTANQQSNNGLSLDTTINNRGAVKMDVSEVSDKSILHENDTMNLFQDGQGNTHGKMQKDNGNQNKMDVSCREAAKIHHLNNTINLSMDCSTNNTINLFTPCEPPTPMEPPATDEKMVSCKSGHSPLKSASGRTPVSVSSVVILSSNENRTILLSDDKTTSPSSRSPNVDMSIDPNCTDITVSGCVGNCSEAIETVRLSSSFRNSYIAVPSRDDFPHEVSPSISKERSVSILDIEPKDTFMACPHVSKDQSVVLETSHKEISVATDKSVAEYLATPEAPKSAERSKTRRRSSIQLKSLGSISLDDTLRVSRRDVSAIHECESPVVVEQVAHMLQNIDFIPNSLRVAYLENVDGQECGNIIRQELLQKLQKELTAWHNRTATTFTDKIVQLKQKYPVRAVAVESFNSSKLTYAERDVMTAQTIAAECEWFSSRKKIAQEAIRMIEPKQEEVLKTLDKLYDDCELCEQEESLKKEVDDLERLVAELECVDVDAAAESRRLEDENLDLEIEDLRLELEVLNAEAKEIKRREKELLVRNAKIQEFSRTKQMNRKIIQDAIRTFASN